MPKRINSDASPKKSSARVPKPVAKRTRLGKSLVDGLTQVLAHARGEIKLESYYLPGPVDVKAIREKTGMSQTAFARQFALSRRTLQEWEQGKAAPDSAVRAYLTVIDRNPGAVVQALRS